MMASEVYEEIWNVSHEFLEKHVSFVHTLTNLMINKSKYLRSNVLNAEARKKSTFTKDFKEAHNALQSMGKSLQSFVSEWDDLFVDESAVLVEKLDIKKTMPITEYRFDYIKPTITYSTNDKLELVVTYINKVQENIFYGMDKSRINEFGVYITPLQEVPKIPLTKLPPSGTVFVVQIEDAWHRAVRNVPVNGDDDDELLALYLLDLGETLPNETTFPIAALDEELSKIPAYAIKFQFKPGTTVPTFSLYDTISCNVVSLESSNLVVVELAQEEFAITRETFTEEELKQLDDLPESTTDAMKAVLGYVPKDDIVYCKHYDPTTKRCFKGSNCRFKHEEKDPDGWTRDKDMISVACPVRMEIPPQDSFVTLMPTFVESVDCFYAQLVSNEKNRFMFQQLMAEMNEPNAVAQYKPLKLMPGLGELVLAKYEDIWYRAAVCDLFESTVNVFYVDYGNVSTVNSDEVRRWEDRFQFVPHQAVCCRFANIRSVKLCHIEAIAELNELILDQKLKALIIDNKHPWDVQLFGDDGSDIGEKLVAAKLALARPPEKFDPNAAIPG